MAYDYDRRASAYGVGSTWQSAEGLKTIEGERPTGSGAPGFIVSTEGKRFPEVIPQANIEREVTRDTKNYESRQRTLKQQQKEDAAQGARDQAKAQHDSWFGFTDKMSPLARKRAVDALNKIVSFNRQTDERGTLIAQRVRAGWRAVNDPTYGEILQGPNEAFLLGKDVTKIGLEFARYLERHH